MIRDETWHILVRTRMASVDMVVDGVQNSKPSVYAVVVNWNRPTDTLKCLASLASQNDITLHTVVVDNGSTDDSVAQIQAAYPDVDLVTSPRNLRFAGGTNLGIRRALDQGADYILILNNDATLHPEGVSTLLKYGQMEGVGLVAPMIYYADSPDRIWSIGGKIRPALLEVTHDAQGQPDPGGWEDYIDQDFVTGCCFLASRRTLDKIGLFDEQFTMYYEDLDFSFRVRNSGLRILVIPYAKAWHAVSTSSGGRDTPNERYWMALSSVFFFRKHARGGNRALIVLWRLGSAIRTTLRLLLKGQIRSIQAYWRGLFEGFKNAITIRPG